MAQAVDGFIPFIDSYPTAFHVVAAIKDMLLNNG